MNEMISTSCAAVWRQALSSSKLLVGDGTPRNYPDSQLVRGYPRDAACLLHGFCPSCECATPGDSLPARFLLAGCEVVNIALHAVELAGSSHRANGVKVSRPGFFAFQRQP